jgi:hypothetical protein
MLWCYHIHPTFESIVRPIASVVKKVVTRTQPLRQIIMLLWECGFCVRYEALAAFQWLQGDQTELENFSTLTDRKRSQSPTGK